MFPPKAAGGPPSARGLRDIRRDVGTTPPEPVAVDEPKPSTATVSTKCPECGCQFDTRFTADVEDAPAPPMESQPLATSGGGPV